MTVFTTDISVTLNDLQAVGASGTDPVLFDNVAAQAVSVIETITGVFFEAQYRETPVSVGDAAWLKKAVVYQIAFMLENPDTLSRMAASSVSQDGVSVSVSDGLAFVLAPLAKRSLANCSWAKSGTIRVAPAEEARANNFLNSDNHPWFPLGAA